MTAVQSLPGHFGSVSPQFTSVPCQGKEPDLSLLNTPLNGFATAEYQEFHDTTDREHICEELDSVDSGKGSDDESEADDESSKSCELTPALDFTGVEGIRPISGNKRKERECCRCFEEGGCLNVEKSLIFYEKLEFPLVFVWKTDRSRYDSESNTLDSDSWITEIDSRCDDEDNLVTPSSESDWNCDSQECNIDLMAGSDVTMKEDFQEDSPEVTPSPMSPDDDVLSLVDSNHNDTKMLSTEAFPFPIHGALHHVLAQAHTLSTVRESVSECEETPDIRAKIPEVDDPFVRRSTCSPPLPNMNFVLTTPEGENLELSPVSEQGSPTIPAHAYGRSRLGAASSSADQASVVTWSPTLSRRRSRRYGKCLDIEEVKELTSRLNLQTRRPSVHAWKQKHLPDNQPTLLTSSDFTCESRDKQEADVRWSPTYRDKINKSLNWIRSELTSMREQDASLARQFLNIRKGMYKLKLERSTLNHQLILDEAMEVEEERDELHRNRDCDLTPDLFSPTLKHVGVTRMNLNCRRFSVF